MNLLLGVAPLPTVEPSGATAGKEAGAPPELLFGALMQTALGPSRVTSLLPLAKTASMPSGTQAASVPGQTARPADDTLAAACRPLVPATRDGERALLDDLLVSPGWDFEALETTSGDIYDKARSVLQGRAAIQAAAVSDEYSPAATNPPGSIGTGTFVPTPAALQLIQDLTPQPLDTLPAGAYIITDARAAEGRLMLDLSPKDPGHPAIRISLPLPQPSEIPAPHVSVPASAARVPLESGASPTALESWFEKVSLKELVVTPAAGHGSAQAGGAAASSEAPCKFEILAENAGRDVVIVTTPAGSDIRFRLLQNRAARPASPGTPGAALAGAKTTPRPAAAAPDTADGHFTDSRLFPLTREIRFLTLAGGRGKAPDASGEAAATLAGSAKGAGADDLRTAAAGERVQTPPARFTLPADVKTALRPGGDSVELRIDPEHLGPARLHLTVRDEHLSARVIVETARAKHTIENSLDRLVETLARADIKVDHIEVAIGQQGARGQWFAQHAPHWPRSGASGGRFDRDDETAPAPPAVPATGSSGYLGAGGVDVLA